MIPMLAPRRTPRRASHLARFAPSGDVGALWIPPRGVDQARLARPDLAMFQQILMAMGYTDRGAMRADGVLGAHTRAAVTAFQRDMQPARLRAETTPLGERVRAFHARTATLAVDGDLGPETQRWLRWFALPTASGGGGEGAGYASVTPTPGVTPSRVTQSGGLHVADVGSVTGNDAPPPAQPAAPVILPGLTTPMLTFAPPAPTAPPPPAPAPPSPAPPSPDAPPPAPPVVAPTPGSPPQALTFTPPATTQPAQASMGAPLLVAGGVAALGLVGWGLYRVSRRR